MTGEGMLPSVLNWDDIPLLCYAAIGPVAWVGMWAGLLLGRSRMNRLVGGAPALPTTAPHVTIVVPAKDEATGIRACVERLLRQDYPSFDVRVIDDRSIDGTSDILDELARNVAQENGVPRENARTRREGENIAKSVLQVMHVAPDALPAGWLGKCHALHVGTRDVTSAWVLFVDSDVTLEPAALRAAMGLALARGYDAVSLMTRLNGRTFLERLMIPVAAGAWAIMFQISLTNNDNRPVAYANGQFLLARREVYERAGNHEAVKGEIVEDCALMRNMKATGAKVRLMIGNHLAATTMHATLGELKSGWGRIYAGTSGYRPWRIIATIVFTITSGLSVYPALVWGVTVWGRTSDPTWLTLSLAHFALMTGHLMYLYRSARGNPLLALLWPVSGVVLLRLLVEGAKRCRNKTIEWRGTTFAAKVQ